MRKERIQTGGGSSCAHLGATVAGVNGESQGGSRGFLRALSVSMGQSLGFRGEPGERAESRGQRSEVRNSRAAVWGGQSSGQGEPEQPINAMGGEKRGAAAGRRRSRVKTEQPRRSNSRLRSASAATERAGRGGLVYLAASRAATRVAACRTPTNCFTGLPSLKIIRVGMLWTPNCARRAGIVHAEFGDFAAGDFADDLFEMGPCMRQGRTTGRSPPGSAGLDFVRKVIGIQVNDLIAHV